MGEICKGMQAMIGKLNHLGLKESQTESIVCDGLHNRTYKFYEEVYFTSSYQIYSSINKKMVMLVAGICNPINTNI